MTCDEIVSMVIIVAAAFVEENLGGRSRQNAPRTIPKASMRYVWHNGEKKTTAPHTDVGRNEY